MANVEQREPSAKKTTTTKPKGEVKRKQSRPIGEFGGNLGCLFWMIFLPALLYWYYGMIVMNKGGFMIPDKKFWYDLYYTLPEGIAIRPTWYTLGLIAAWIVSQAMMELLIPSYAPFGFGVTEGVILKNGNRLKYQMNGLFSFFLTHVLLYAAAYGGLIDAQIAWSQMGALLTGGNITAFVFAVWLYIDWGIFWKRHVNDPGFEEDWGVFNYKEFFCDFFLGVARNPRIFHGWFEVPLDLKRWWDGRTLTLWVILNQSYIMAQYYGCVFEFEKYVADGTGPVCSSNGSWENVGYASWMITFAHWYYIFDYNYCEPAYLTTTDIRHDLFGFMLTYGMFGYLVWYYPYCYLGFLSAHGENPITENYIYVGIGTALYVFGMFMFRYCNIQKHNFRTFIADLKAEGKSPAEVEKALGSYIVWGKPVKYIRTQEGSYLLMSGTWGLGRHFNYIGDMVMCVGWTVACYSPNHPFPLVPLSYPVYFWVMDIHRLFRDEHRCQQKYKKDWIKYEEAVPWRILPGVW